MPHSMGSLCTMFHQMSGLLIFADVQPKFTSTLATRNYTPSSTTRCCQLLLNFLVTVNPACHLTGEGIGFLLGNKRTVDIRNQKFTSKFAPTSELHNSPNVPDSVPFSSHRLSQSISPTFTGAIRASRIRPKITFHEHPTEHHIFTLKSNR